MVKGSSKCKRKIFSNVIEFPQSYSLARARRCGHSYGWRHIFGRFRFRIHPRTFPVTCSVTFTFVLTAPVSKGTARGPDDLQTVLLAAPETPIFALRLGG